MTRWLDLAKIADTRLMRNRFYMQPTNKQRAVILGAGPVGLVCAWQLLEHGWEVDLFEKNDRVGGMCRTWQWRDFLVDTGPHIFHTPDAKLSAFWEEHFGDLFVKGEFWCKNVRGERFDEYWDYPLSWESITKFPQVLKEQVLRELDVCDHQAKARATNYTQYIEAQVGSTLRKMFFETYPKKIWGIPTDEMAPDWAPKRVEFRQKITPFYVNQWNAVGKFGTGCVYERIAEKIRALGGRIHLEQEVRRIVADGTTLTAIEFAQRAPFSLAPDDVVISSLPITLTARFFGYTSALTFRGICSLYLAYRKLSILPGRVHWLYYGDEHIDFNRVTEPKKLSPHVAPNDESYLTAEITYSRGDAIDTMDPEVLARRVAEQMGRVGLAPQADVIDWSINKEPFVYPLQYTGYQEELAKTRAAVSRFPKLYSLGTGGDFNYADSQILFHKAFDTVAVLCDKDSAYTQVVRQMPRCELKSHVTIGSRTIGEGERPFIIAEAGLNHNGSIDMAKALIDAAVEAGVNAVKFQTFTASKRISNKVKGVHYAETVIGLEETLFEMFDRLTLPAEAHVELFAYARAKGLEIFSTPFDETSVELLESLGVALYKIASMDLVNLPLIRIVARTGKPMILSTGMSTMGHIEEALDVIRAEGNAQVALLHCNSSYPAAPAEMNLRAIETLHRAFCVPTGLSDHTFGLSAAHTALARGAHVIERHFTLDRTLEGPDQMLSSEPEEMKRLVTLAETIPLMLGDGIKRIQPNEYQTLNQQRKSLYAARSMKCGEVITISDVMVKGPGGGLLPRYLDIIVGRTVRRDIEEDFPITWDYV